MGISAVVNTFNSEDLLDEALGSLTPWVDELVVVDMHSTDRTRQIAERHGARVFLHDPVGYVEPAREFAVEQATSEWVMILDSDEIVPRPLAERLQQVAAGDEADVVDIPRLNYFFGRPVTRGRWRAGRNPQRRFFKRGTLTFSSVIHSVPEAAPRSRIVQLPDELAIVHFNYVSTAEFLERADRYTDRETDRPPRRAREPLALAVNEARMALIEEQGIRDGVYGLTLTGAMIAYHWMAWLKRVERHEPEKRGTVPVRLVSIALSALSWTLRRMRFRPA